MRIYDARSDAAAVIRSALISHQLPVNAVQWSPINANQLVSGSSDTQRNLMIWDIRRYDTNDSGIAADRYLTTPYHAQPESPDAQRGRTCGQGVWCRVGRGRDPAQRRRGLGDARACPRVTE